VQRPDIRAVIDLMRRYRVSVAVAGEEYHITAADPAEGERTRRLAVRRTDHLTARHLQVRQLCQSGAADDR
jgi:hypothetical protein